MSTIDCPLCGHEHDSGHYPDHISEARNGRFEFGCASCGAEFEVLIDWHPTFWSNADTAKPKPPEPAE